MDALAQALAADLDGAFAALVEAHGGAVHSLLVRAGAGHDAEDLAQETFVAAYADLRRRPPEQVQAIRLRPWLAAIAVNLLRNDYRRRSRRPRTAAMPPEPAWADAGERPEDAALRHDLAARLGGLLAALPEAHRLAVVLRHVVGMPYAEVAETLGIPVGTAKVHAHRGVQRLRMLLDHEEVPA